MAKTYVPLHNHSDGSLLDGFAKVPEYVALTKELGLPGMGLSDHGNPSKIYGFIEKMREVELTPVPGCEFYVAPINPLGAKVKEAVFYGEDGQKAGNYDVASNGAYLHMTIFAVDQVGLHNLFKLATLSNDPERYRNKPRIDFDLLEEHSEGLVVLSGCPSSEISTRFLLGQDQKAYEYARRLEEVFGKERFFIEIMNHSMRNPIERILLPKQVEMAKKMGLGLVATNDCHYAHKEDAVHHEEMLCTQSGARMRDKPSDDGGNRFAFDGQEYYLKSAEEMYALFPEEDYPQALSNTLLIAEMASSVRIDFDPHLKPKARIPEGHSEESYFKALINEGFKKRYGHAPREVKREAKRRIDHEYKVIYSSDFVGYFLTVYEYLKYARENFSTRNEAGEFLAYATGPGRGSVGGSIIAYLLEISELCPIKHNLIFERFLSAGRGATYRIEYTDGTFEDIVVSAEKQVVTPEGELTTRYIHQLEVGDEIEVAEAEEASEETSEA